MHETWNDLLKIRILNKNNLKYFDMSQGFNKKLNFTFNEFIF